MPMFPSRSRAFSPSPSSRRVSRTRSRRWPSFPVGRACRPRSPSSSPFFSARRSPASSSGFDSPAARPSNATTTASRSGTATTCASPFAGRTCAPRARRSPRRRSFSSRTPRMARPSRSGAKSRAERPRRAGAASSCNGGSSPMRSPRVVSVVTRGVDLSRAADARPPRGVLPMGRSNRRVSILARGYGPLGPRIFMGFAHGPARPRRRRHPRVPRIPRAPRRARANGRGPQAERARGRKDGLPQPQKLPKRAPSKADVALSRADRDRARGARRDRRARGGRGHRSQGDFELSIRRLE